MFLLASIVLAKCRIGRFDTRLDYLHIYSWYSDELVEVIKKTNSEYENALRIAYHTPSANKDIAIAIENINNCSDTNNTLCKTPNKDYSLNKFTIEHWMCYAILTITILLCLTRPFNFNKNWRQQDSNL